jgi:hypothetical protein
LLRLVTVALVGQPAQLVEGRGSGDALLDSHDIALVGLDGANITGMFRLPDSAFFEAGGGPDYTFNQLHRCTASPNGTR